MKFGLFFVLEAPDGDYRKAMDPDDGPDPIRRRAGLRKRVAG